MRVQCRQYLTRRTTTVSYKHSSQLHLRPRYGHVYAVKQN